MRECKQCMHAAAACTPAQDAVLPGSDEQDRILAEARNAIKRHAFQVRAAPSSARPCPCTPALPAIDSQTPTHFHALAP